MCWLLYFTCTVSFKLHNSGRCIQLSTHTLQTRKPRLTCPEPARGRSTQISGSKAQAAKLVQPHQVDANIISILWKGKLRMGDIW